MVSDDDWDYHRTAGVCIDENKYLSIVFQSTISNRIVPSTFKVKLKEWFHIVLVQEREEGILRTRCILYPADHSRIGFV